MHATHTTACCSQTSSTCIYSTASISIHCQCRYSLVGSTTAYLRPTQLAHLLCGKHPVDEFYNVELCLVQLTSRGAHLTHKHTTDSTLSTPNTQGIRKYSAALYTFTCLRLWLTRSTGTNPLAWKCTQLTTLYNSAIRACCECAIPQNHQQHFQVITIKVHYMQLLASYSLFTDSTPSSTRV